MAPAEVKEYFFKKLQESLPKTKIEVGTLAITVHYKDMDIQLLPAVRYKEGYKIPNASGKDWSNIINPKKFAEKLSEINRKNNFKVVPSVKIAKAIISGMPKNRQLSGYHTEALAIEVFKYYDGAKTPKAMLTYFFETAPRYISKPIIDKTGQSKYVDEYCGKIDGSKRELIANAISRIGRTIKNADKAYSLNTWKRILEID